MSEPIYRIIESDIKENLKKGILKEGDMLSSENELKDHYKVSRMTVRQALNNLVNEGYLFRHKGKGTFVSKTKIEKKIQGLQSFTEEMKRMNRTVKNQIISTKLVEANDEVSAKLLLNRGDLVYWMQRVRFADDIPVLFEELYVPKSIIKELTPEILEGSFYNYLENTLKLKISYSIQNIEAKIASEPISSYLEVDNGSPILYITLNSFLDNNRPFEYVKSHYRADQYRFVQHALR
jgi:GntR family transcriptional regulator